MKNAEGYPDPTAGDAIKPVAGCRHTYITSTL